MALIGIGFRRLSMNASAIARIRLMTRSLNLTGLAAYIDTIIDGADHTLRNKLADFARDHGVRIWHTVAACISVELMEAVLLCKCLRLPHL